MSMADRIAVMSEGTVQQVATPVEMYQRPSNMFVADFIGTSNRFEGIPKDQGIDVPGLGVLPGTAPRGLVGKVNLVVRPEDVRVVASGGVLTGTVLLSTMTRYSFKTPAISRATASM